MIDRISKDLDSAFGAVRRRAEGRLSSAEEYEARAKQAVARAGELIAGYPVAALATAVLLGVALGWWVKRK
ncbi:MAG: hypothetical protein ACYC6Y_32280 [Thermoguttaceae bacterium]